MLKKEDIINNKKFISRCEYYGLDYRNIEIINDIIVLSTTNNNLYILFDGNFNIIDVAKTRNNGKFVISKVSNTIPLGENFEYINPQLIIKVANRVILSEKDQGRSLKIKIADSYVNEIIKEQEYFLQIISYIKFLGEELEKFFLNSYHLALVIDNDIPDSELYLQGLIKKINEYIDLCINKNQEPSPDKLLKYLGQNKPDNLHKLMLKDVINLITKDKGYVFDNKTNKFEKINSDIKENYTEIYNQLIELANLTEQDIIERQWERLKKSMELSHEFKKMLLKESKKYFQYESGSSFVDKKNGKSKAEIVSKINTKKTVKELSYFINSYIEYLISNGEKFEKIEFNIFGDLYIDEEFFKKNLINSRNFNPSVLTIDNVLYDIIPLNIIFSSFENNDISSMNDLPYSEEFLDLGNIRYSEFVKELEKLGYSINIKTFDEFFESTRNICKTATVVLDFSKEKEKTKKEDIVEEKGPVLKKTKNKR